MRSLFVRAVTVTWAMVFVYGCSDEPETPVSPPSTTGWTNLQSPATVDLYGVWAYSETGLFAVGDGGTIVRYDGGAWTKMASGTTENLNDVWGTAPDDVYATGDNATVLHYDGTSWSQPYDFWDFNGDIGRMTVGYQGSTPIQAYAVVDNNPDIAFIGLGERDFWFFRKDSSGDPGQINALAVFGQVNPYDFAETYITVGDNGGVYYAYCPADCDIGYIVWHAMDSGTTEDLVGVYGGSRPDLIAIGANGTVIRNDGFEWYPVSGTSPGGYSAISARGYNDLFLFGSDGLVNRYDHCSFSQMNSGTTAGLLDGDASPEGRVFACGSGGTVLSYGDPATGSDCPDNNLIVTVTGGLNPTISWSPACNLSKLFVEPSRWFISSAGNNIEPGVVYGVAPACAEEIRWAAPLEEGHMYSVALVKRDRRGDLIVGRFNYSPSESAVFVPAQMSSAYEPRFGTYCQTVRPFFQTPPGEPEEMTWGSVEPIQFVVPWQPVRTAVFWDEIRNPETGLVELRQFEIEVIEADGMDVLGTVIPPPQ